MAFRSVHGPSRRHTVYREVTDPAGDELARLYAKHSRLLLQLAALLVPDLGAAREVMYEAFAALDRGHIRARRSGDEFAFLLHAVVYRARTARLSSDADSRIDGARVVAPGSTESAMRGTVVPEGAVLAALRGLPAAQREALVLRYYGQLSDEQAAAAMGVRPAELRTYVTGGMAALRAALARNGHAQPGCAAE
ncbi:MAG TPA: sigma factor-like helix-turn-helix DNA-binding protein [Trebonia sp.]